MVETILKKVSPALYQVLGSFLYSLITTNRCILGVAILVQRFQSSGQEMFMHSSTALGFGLCIAFCLLALREQMSLVRIPKGMKVPDCF